MHKGSREIIVAVHVGAVKIYAAAAVEALRKKRKTGWNSVAIKIDGFPIWGWTWLSVERNDNTF